MTEVVFVGPTLSADAIAAVLPNVVCMPPVRQGDVYRAARSRPRALGIIDGYFSGAPSVWHKEILWAMANGVAVFGSASMGALRAAELHSFGMRGVGRIFEAFRAGELEDDDEVAVVHGPAETGYLMASEPMVNMRATLAKAEGEGILTRDERATLERIAKSLFFPDRNWPGVLRAAADQGVSGSRTERFQKWLLEGAVDQKREDALEMLEAMRSFREAPEATAPSFHFEATHFWSDMVARFERQPAANGSGDIAPAAIVDEFRLEDPQAYRRVKMQALLRMLAYRGVPETQPVAAQGRTAASTEIRAALGLFSRGKMEGWLLDSGLDERGYEDLVESEARLCAVADACEPYLTPFLLDELRLSGAYPRLARRALNKARRLAGGPDRGRRSGAVPGPLELRIWFFSKRLGQGLPDDIAAFARMLGFAGAAELDRVLYDEWLYSRLKEPASVQDQPEAGGPVGGMGGHA